jgi:hypothetical protein
VDKGRSGKMTHEWIKEGLCVTCKHKETCKKIQAGIVVWGCDIYEGNEKTKVRDEIA